MCRASERSQRNEEDGQKRERGIINYAATSAEKNNGIIVESMDYVIHRRGKAKSHSYTFFDIALFLWFAVYVLNLLSSSPLARVFPRTISASHDTVVTLSLVLRYEITFIEELTRLKRLHRYWISLKCDKRKFANCFETLFMRDSLWQFSILLYFQVRPTA